MRFTSLALIPALFAGFSYVAYADLEPAPDPQISIDAGGFSSPISLGAICPISPDGGGICDFFNDTGSTINLLEFEDSVGGPELTGLPPGSGIGAYLPPPATPTFTCDPTDVFAQCVILFQTPPVTTTDEVTILFSGGAGIAPGEHFLVNLNNNNALTGDVGGWNTVDAGTFHTVEINTNDGLFTGVPEPSMTWLVAAGLLLIFGARRLRALI
ncbi:MAG TPA: PEP-CTERM sorting domain-containing protein [Bryobacteraceae bacterium]|jgi:hypothetical protein